MSVSLPPTETPAFAAGFAARYPQLRLRRATTRGCTSRARILRVRSRCQQQGVVNQTQTASLLHKNYSSRQAVPTIDDNIRASRVCRRIRGQVQVSALELEGLTLPTHWDLRPPDGFGLRRHEVGNLCGHVARRDCVDASEPDPFHGERLAEVNHACFCGVVLAEKVLAADRGDKRKSKWKSNSPPTATAGY